MANRPEGDPARDDVIPVSNGAGPVNADGTIDTLRPCASRARTVLFLRHGLERPIRSRYVVEAIGAGGGP